MKNRRATWQLILALVWVVVSLSLASWWIIFSHHQLASMRTLEVANAAKLVRQQTMLVWEGMFLCGLFIVGGLSLLYFIFKEKRQSLLIRQFFAGFTHEVKTALAGVRLQAESLSEDLQHDPDLSTLTRRLVKDTVRLELQLENSLFLARQDEGQMFVEKLSLKNLLASLQLQWPEVTLEADRDVEIVADRRVFECLLKNIIQNAVIHGQAQKIRFQVEALPTGLSISVHDDGSGFHGDRQRLGQIFVRHTKKSGSGVGLYLVQQMMKRLGGRADFPVAPVGFAVRLEFPKGVAV